ncbi:hypothetical protein ACSBR1_022309 [Camellia fascicularis]
MEEEPMSLLMEGLFTLTVMRMRKRIYQWFLMHLLGHQFFMKMNTMEMLTMGFSIIHPLNPHCQITVERERKSKKIGVGTAKNTLLSLMTLLALLSSTYHPRKISHSPPPPPPPTTTTTKLLQWRKSWSFQKGALQPILRGDLHFVSLLVSFSLHSLQINYNKTSGLEGRWG